MAATVTKGGFVGRGFSRDNTVKKLGALAPEVSAIPDEINSRLLLDFLNTP
jgi:hypothetical protein